MTPGLVLPLVLAFVSCATGGYAAYGSEDVPFAVREASRAALRLVLFPPANAQILSPELLPHLEQLLSDRRTSGDLSAGDASLFEILCEDLRRAGAPRNIGPAAQAMAFVAEDPTLLVTCRHNLEEFSDPAQLIGQGIAIVLIDQRGMIVFDSRHGTDAAVLESVGSADSAKLTGIDTQGGRTIASDFAYLRLDRALDVQPLDTARDEARRGQRVWVPHYQFPDMWPQSLRPCFSVGNLQSLPQTGVRYRDGIVRASPELAEHALGTTCPGGPGLSGAPLLDAAGRLVGMITGGIAGEAIGIRGLPTP